MYVKGKCFCGSGKKHRKCHSTVMPFSKLALLYLSYKRFDARVQDLEDKSNCINNCCSCCMADDLNELADIRSQELVNEYATGTVHSGLSKYDPFWQGLADKSLGEVAGVATLALVEDYDGYDIVRRWMNSPAHRASIMDENGMDRMEIGISCYTVAGSVYWIAVIR